MSVKSNINEIISIREKWIKKIENLKGSFSDNSEFLERELNAEINEKGMEALIAHLHLCGNIPESYGHDTTEEKLYSKYTDCLLASAYKMMGIKSLVLSERADVADVEGYTDNFEFVADAKAFRLSRTAKNQKDFKIQSMDRWKHGKPFAMVVSTIYQMPNRTSQIYEQAITKNVCIFTYSHLSLLVRFAFESGAKKSKELLYIIFKTIPALNPSKNAVDYWLGVNKTILNYSSNIAKLWQEEKIMASNTISIAKQEALKYLSEQRKKIMQLSHEEALKQLVNISRIENKIKIINNVSNNDLLNIK